MGLGFRVLGFWGFGFRASGFEGFGVLWLWGLRVLGNFRVFGVLAVRVSGFRALGFPGFEACVSFVAIVRV